jgi:septum site-determining protein MinC
MLQCIVPEDADDATMLAWFDQVLAGGLKLLEGNLVVMDMGGRPLDLALIAKIYARFLEPANCRVASWIVLDGASQDMMKRIGLPTGEPKLPAKGKNAPKAKQGLLFSGTLRGGQRIEHDGDVIVAGHANTGSEILATGHVVVLGWLKGLVHAGCEGDEEMSVTARSFESGQVRIGRKVGLVDKSSHFWGKSAVVTVSDGEVVIGEWPSI